MNKIEIIDIVEHKKCTKCDIERELNEFSKDKKSKDGLKYQCKNCMKEYYKENKEKIKAQKKKYKEENKEKIAKYQKNYRKENKEKEKKREKEWRDKNKEKIKAQKKKYGEENKEKIKAQKKKYYKENKEKILAQKKKYKEENKEKIAKYQKNWYKNNPCVVTWRSILKTTLKRMDLNKTHRTIDMLGYSADDLKKHIEYLFTEGMSWENHGEWHIDHKIPLSAFDENTPICVVNSLENLQPLWANDNLFKSNKIFEEYKSMDIYIKYCT